MQVHVLRTALERELIQRVTLSHMLLQQMKASLWCSLLAVWAAVAAAAPTPEEAQALLDHELEVQVQQQASLESSSRRRLRPQRFGLTLQMPFAGRASCHCQQHQQPQDTGAHQDWQYCFGANPERGTYSTASDNCQTYLSFPRCCCLRQSCRPAVRGLTCTRSPCRRRCSTPRTAPST